MVRRLVQHTALRGKIEQAFMAMTGKHSPYGAVTWFAKRVDRSDRTVRAWCDGERDPPRSVLLLMEYMEQYEIEPDRWRAAGVRRSQWYATKHTERGG